MAERGPTLGEVANLLEASADTMGSFHLYLLELHRLRKATAWLMKMAAEGEEPVFDWMRDRNSEQEFIRLRVGTASYTVTDTNFLELVEQAMEDSTDSE